MVHLHRILLWSWTCIAIFGLSSRSNLLVKASSLEHFHISNSAPHNGNHGKQHSVQENSLAQKQELQKNTFKRLLSAEEKRNELDSTSEDSQAMVQRDASTITSGGNVYEGVNHNPIRAPPNSSYIALPIGINNEKVGSYWSQNPNTKKATQAFIMMHGKLRDGDKYWTVMNNILQSAIQNKSQSVDSNAIIVAPQFFSARDNSGQYDSQTLAWADVNAWQAGERAVHPQGTNVTSFDALNALAGSFLNPSIYPAMERLTIIGHGGGGQLIQRYATVGTIDSNDHVHVRFVHGDPSSCNYFTTDRPTMVNETLPTKNECPLYNTWRYGFDNFSDTTGQKLRPQDYFQQYISRDVVSIIGYQDTAEDGDNYCMAKMQGGVARRNRNLIWWQYVNLLARTGENLIGFPGKFDSGLPDWSTFVKDNIFGLHLMVVKNADHNPELVFESEEGRAALLNTDPASLPLGWRPDGWKNTSNAVPPPLLTVSQSVRGRNQNSSSHLSAKFSSLHPFLIVSSTAVLLSMIL